MFGGLIYKIVTLIKKGSAGPAESSVIFAASDSSPFIHAYAWSSSGFGTKYADPTTLPSLGGSKIDVSPDSSAVVLSTGTSPFMHAYAWSNSTGFGTKFSDPSTPLTNVNSSKSIKFSNNGNAIVVGARNSSNNTNRFTAYSWSSSGFGAKLNEVNISSDITVEDISFNSDDSVVAVSQPTPPYIHAYTWSNSTGFGTKFSNPSTILGANHVADSCAFSPNSQHLAVAASLFNSSNFTFTPVQIVYNWNNSTGFGSKVNDPSVALSGASNRGVRFSKDGNVILYVTQQSPRLHAYAWSSSGYGTKFSNPSTTPTNQSLGIGVSKSKNIVAVTEITTPLQVWDFTSTGFGTKYSDPTSVISSTSRSAAFN